MWDGAQSNFEVAALKLGFPEMDNQTVRTGARSKKRIARSR